MQSMTAFARSQNQSEGYLYCWELRSVNHRYLDISFRIPDAFRGMENSLRYKIRDYLQRGKIDCQLKIHDALDAATPAVLVNTSLIRTLSNAAAEIATVHQLANDMTVSNFLAWPGIIQQKEPDADALQASLERGFNDALEQLLVVRRTEGSGLKHHIQSRIDQLQEVIRLARTQVDLISVHTREKLIARLEHLQLGVNEARIEQEIAMILIRLDVSEELDRLETHLLEVERTVSHDTVAGKRLDFLMQELNREANTLSSKSDSVVLTQHAVQMKVLIEQMREQIQNIE